jgi:hypothetical protein
MPCVKGIGKRGSGTTVCCDAGRSSHMLDQGHRHLWESRRGKPGGSRRVTSSAMVPLVMGHSQLVCQPLLLGR